MNICVFGAAEDMPREIMKAGESVGDLIAQNGFGLVYGGFGDGLLGAVAEHAAAGASKIIGVFPAEKRKNHTEFDGCTQVLRSPDKRERKKKCRRKTPTHLWLCRMVSALWTNCLRFCC